MGSRAQLTGCHALLLLHAAVALCFCFLAQQAGAQDFSGLNGVTVLRQVPYNESLAKQDWEGLRDKYWQLRNDSGASLVQMELLSARSRAKLNLISGEALQYLQNRTDGQFAEILESIRATNFRRAMAINVIFSSVRGAFTSGNVLGMLQALQVEDLERLASLPLHEKKYQALTNVTLLGMLEEIYGYGQTQVKKRTCVLTAANTSTVVPLINSATTSLAKHRRSLRSSMDPLAQTAAEFAAIRVRHLLDEASLTEAVMVATQDEYLLEPATFFRDFRGSRKLAQQIDSATPAEDDSTVAFLVMHFMRRMGLNGTAASESGRPGNSEGNTPPYLNVPPHPPGTPIAGSGGRMFTPLNFTDENDFAEQFTANGEELPPPQYEYDYDDDPCANATAAEALGINCTASYEYSLDYGSSSSPDGLDTLDDADLLAPADGTNQTEAEDCTTERVANSTMVTVTCNNGTTDTFRKDPCLERDANGTLLEPEACKALGKCTRNNTYVLTGEPCDYNATHPCKQRRIMGTTQLTVMCNNGTTYNYTRDPCKFRKNGTVVHAAACAALGPCLPNNTYANSGERCKYNVSVSRLPCVDGVRNGTDVPCNSTTANGTASGNRTTTDEDANLPCVNGTLNGTDAPCNATEATLEAVPCVNGTRNGTDIPCTEEAAADSVLPCINGTLNGTDVPCNASSSELGTETTNSTGVLPCVNGTEEGTGAPCNSTEAPGELPSLPCVDGYLNGTETPCNGTEVTNSTAAENNSTAPCVNGTLDGTDIPCTGEEAPPPNNTSIEAGAGEVNSTLPCVDGVLEGTDMPCNASTAADNSTTTTDVLDPSTAGNSTDLQSNTTTTESGLPPNCFEIATGMVICNSPEPGNTTMSTVGNGTDELLTGPATSEDGSANATDSNTTASDVTVSPLPGDVTAAEPSPSPEPRPADADEQLSPSPVDGNTTEGSTDQPSPSPATDGAAGTEESPAPTESPDIPTLDDLLLGQLGTASPSPGPADDTADPLLTSSPSVGDNLDSSPSPDPAVPLPESPAASTDQEPPDVLKPTDGVPSPAPEPAPESPDSATSPEPSRETDQPPETPQSPESTSSPTPDPVAESPSDSPELSPDIDQPSTELPGTQDPINPNPPSELESGTDPCAGLNCGDHGSCNIGVCECTGGWSGTSCEVPPATQQEDPCAGVNCGSHGTCNAGVCACTDGYTGTLCETSPPEAPVEADPCAAVNCGAHGTCSGGSCSCSDGYTGAFCDTPPDLCAGKSCNGHGTCSSGVCSCSDGWAGSDCEVAPQPAPEPQPETVIPITEPDATAQPTQDDPGY